MKLKTAIDVVGDISKAGIFISAIHGPVLYRKTPQAIVVRKLKEAGYEEITWDQSQWEAYYTLCREAMCHNYIGAGMKANILVKSNNIVVVGRNANSQWVMMSIDQ